MTDRDELTRDVIDGSQRMHVNTSYGLQDGIADHLRRLGYRKPRTLTTLGPLWSLPRGSVVRRADGKVMLRSGPSWWEECTATGLDGFSTPTVSWLPVTVLHEPEGGA